MLITAPTFSPLYENIIVVVLGLLVGSFLNVVIHRLPLGKSIVKPRSHCPHCGHSFPFFLNIPVLSYLFLLGKCSKCKAPISIRYPLVELITAVLFLAAKIRFGFSGVLFIRDFPFIAILVAVTFIDLQHRIIPDSLSLGGLALGLLTSFLDPELGWEGALIGAAFGFAFFYGIAWFYVWRTGRMGLGGGDIKLLAMLGATIGFKGVVTTIFLSSIIGSLFGIILALREKSKANSAAPYLPVAPAVSALPEKPSTAEALDPSEALSASEADTELLSDSDNETAPGLMKFSIPYGPFLVVGALYYYLLGEILWHPLMNL